MARKDMGMAGYVTDREVSEWKRSRHERLPDRRIGLSDIIWGLFVAAAMFAFLYVGTWAAAIVDCGM